MGGDEYGVVCGWHVALGLSGCDCFFQDCGASMAFDFMRSKQASMEIVTGPRSETDNGQLMKKGYE